MRGRSRFACGLAGLAAVLIASEAARWIASRARAPLRFDVGPSTGEYLPGFTESEERLPATFRWTGEKSSILLPLEAEAGGGTIQLRYARFLESHATVRLFVDGERLASFAARPGRFRTHEIRLPASRTPETTAMRLDLLVEDPDPAKLGIAVDWLRIEGPRFHLPASAFAPRLFLLGAFLLPLWLGLSCRAALAIGTGTALAEAAWFAVDPFAMAHALSRIAVPGLAASFLLALGFRRLSGSARWVPLLFLLGYATKGGALFHPSYFYPDVRLHRRHLEAFEAAKGSILERGVEAQKAAFTAYPRRVAGRDYAFPYSPFFYLPFTLLDRDARGIEAAMKHAGLLLAALELPLVYVLARSLLGAEAALWAAILVPLLPPMVSRLLYAQWPTLAGHALDLIALFYAGRAAALASWAGRPLLLYAASGFLSSTVYISSLINLTAFTWFLFLFDRKRARLLPLVWIAVAAAAVIVAYLPFTTLFLTEIVPALLRGEGGGTGNPPGGWLTSVWRIHLFYGFGFPALAVAGFVLARRDRGSAAARILTAYGAAFLLLLALRALSGMFKDLKEVELAGPLVAITAGVSLDSLWRRNRSGRWAAALVTAGLVGFGAAKFLEYFHQHTALAGLRLE